jgi:glycosyltransferase involved in cell wall biosynthesis
MRGFDMFMRSAKIIAQRYPDVLFFVVGSEKMSYGGDEEHIKPYKTFKEWTLAQQTIRPVEVRVHPQLDQVALGKLLATTDLHIYLTVPFVLSWSMMDAMSCGAVVLGSATSPVKEMIRHGENGLLADFFSPGGFCG